MANPYLAFAAMLMAGLDGIKNKIHPGKAMDKDLYDLPPKELKKIPTVCGSLREALESLDKDRKFLTAGGVFDDDQIDSFIELKMAEVMRFDMTPHPVEYDMYYSAYNENGSPGHGAGAFLPARCHRVPTAGCDTHVTRSAQILI